MHAKAAPAPPLSKATAIAMLEPSFGDSDAGPKRIGIEGVADELLDHLRTKGCVGASVLR
jgi:hypothetical protein